MQTREIRILDRTFAIEWGRVAHQANGAVLMREGDTVVLVTVVAAEEPREGTDFFPLTVEYRERFSAVGRFPGGYRKREGQAGEHEILTSRLIDRSIRPLFPEGYRCEVQLLATVLACGQDGDPGSWGSSARRQRSRYPISHGMGRWPRPGSAARPKAPSSPTPRGKSVRPPRSI